jgi:hypothetical protein
MELAPSRGLMRISTKAAASILAALILAAPLHAQSSDGNGLWLGAGVGAGWVRVSCDICQASRDLGPSAFARVGTVLKPGLRVAAEITAWTHEAEDVRENLGAAMAVLYLQPHDGALYFKTGLGYVGYRAGDDIALNSAGVQLGGGYELRIGSLALSNYLNLVSSSFGSLKNEDTTIADDVRTTLMQFGIAFNLR